jgi:hypothetical protein
VLVQVKNKRERSLPVRPPGVEKTSRLRSRDSGGQQWFTRKPLVTRLSYKTEAEDSTRRCGHPGRFNRPGGAVRPFGPIRLLGPV